MLQALVKRGKVLAEQVPRPVVSDGCALIKVMYSCISAGTELTGIHASGKSIIRRALEQPQNIVRAWQMAQREGLKKTLDVIQGKLEEGMPIGYSASGVVFAVGQGVTGINPGDRVAAAGAGIANHAEWIDVPANLIMKIPDPLSYQQAATVTMGGIAMQGVRRAGAQLGEFVVIFGAGILGQLALQMLLAAGARVIAIDIDRSRLDLARKMGAEMAILAGESDAVQTVHHYTNGHGADVTLFCAATDDSTALSQAFQMTRRKGRVVMLGVWGKELKREDIYRKELDFLISTSYGPGRYDDNYEKKGLDYPYAYIRWSENRNMSEYLRLLAHGKVNIEALIGAVYPIEQVQQAYAALQNSASKPLIVLLAYDHNLPENFEFAAPQPNRIANTISFQPCRHKTIRVGVIGAGAFVAGVHLPNLQELGEKYQIQAICNRTGSKAKAVATRFGASYSTSDYREVLADPEVDLVLIGTRHHLHGQIVLDALAAGKPTFVEKPLCTLPEELKQIKQFYEQSQHPPLLLVGFNRRFSRYARQVRAYTANNINPLFIHYRMNAGYIPLEHWVHSQEGGGRIIGEACHIIDLFSYLIASPVKSISSTSLIPKTGSISSRDNQVITLQYLDGSVATLEYFAVGNKKLAKETLEVHFDGKTIVVDNYRSLIGYGIDIEPMESTAPDKGHLEEFIVLHRALTENDGIWPIQLADMLQTTEITFAIGDDSAGI